MRLVKTGLLAAALCGMLTVNASAAGPAVTTHPWQEMLHGDLAFLKKTIRTRYIYALTPGGEAFDRTLTAALVRARKEGGKVRDLAGYQAVLTHFTSAFVDAHVSMRFYQEPVDLEWPQFLVRYRADMFVVAHSQTQGVAPGTVISGCDGKDLAALIDAVAPFFSRIGGLESTRDALAKTYFLDVKNPLYVRPVRCRINGVDIQLQWQRVAAPTVSRLNDALSPPREKAAYIEEFGDNSAWVRIQTMHPVGEGAREFRDIIERAPALRTKDLIILDVRGNGGGEYNWFMAFLCALYGKAYTDYYARARLAIHPVFVDNPTAWLRKNPADDVAAPEAIPPDRALDEALSHWKLIMRPAAQGRTVYAMEPDAPAPPLGPAPPAALKARVFVLTDAGCGSACISFVDELRRIPGVVQVGRETFVDSRSGTPIPYPLPSGLGEIRLPNMVRENRERGDNVPQLPAYVYPGDIADTAAVRSWIVQLADSPRQ